MSYSEQIRKIVCPDCNCYMLLKRGKYGLFYQCLCGLVHGAHKDNGKPLGIPANSETRQLRIQAHQAFDHWWKSNSIKRSLAYQKLANVLGVPMTKAHIGMLDKNQCLRTIRSFSNGEHNNAGREQAYNSGRIAEAGTAEDHGAGETRGVC